MFCIYGWKHATWRWRPTYHRLFCQYLGLGSVEEKLYTSLERSYEKYCELFLASCTKGTFVTTPLACTFTSALSYKSLSASVQGENFYQSTDRHIPPSNTWGEQRILIWQPKWSNSFASRDRGRQADCVHAVQLSLVVRRKLPLSPVISSRS